MKNEAEKTRETIPQTGGAGHWAAPFSIVPLPRSPESDAKRARIAADYDRFGVWHKDGKP